MVAGTVWSASMPGAPEWDIVVGDRFVAAIAASAPEHVMLQLAQLALDPDVSLETVVGVVPAGRVDPVESFALAWWPGADPGEVTTVARGAAVVDLESVGGSRRFDARGIRPWHLAEFHEVSRLRVTDERSVLDAVGTRPAHLPPLAPTRFRASSVSWAAESALAAPSVGLGTADSDTVLSPRRRRMAIADTIIGGRRAAAPSGWSWADVSTQPLQRQDQDEDDAASVPILAIPRYRVAGGAPRSASGVVLLGRRPLARRMPEGDADLVEVPSPRSLVSATHLELRVVGTRLVATDLHSSNGTTVRTSTGPRRLRAGESIVVGPGTVLDLGGDTIIEILPAQEDPRSSADGWSRT